MPATERALDCGLKVKPATGLASAPLVGQLIAGVRFGIGNHRQKAVEIREIRTLGTMPEVVHGSNAESFSAAAVIRNWFIE